MPDNRNHVCFFSAILLLIAATFPQLMPAQDALSTRDQKSVATFEKSVTKATEAWQSKQAKAALTSTKKAISQLKKLVRKPTPDMTKALAGPLAKLTKLHGELVAKGAKLPKMPQLPADPKSNMDTNVANVSFKTDIAPILNSKCGNCHVRRSRGEFSLASFAVLAAGDSIVAGKPANSRLIEVIESGEMPQGGGTVSPAELDKLKAWVSTGAKFDGDDPAANLATYGGPMANRQMAVTVNRPKGNETVSFALDVAPVLQEKCGRCHTGRNPRGNLDMANFRQLLRGGDGGAPLKANDSKMSPIIDRIRGDGVRRMPPVGDALDKDTIQKFVTWINEGAAFDGDAPTTPLAAVAGIAKAQSMSHKELATYRQTRSLATWKLAMTDVQAESLTSDNFYVLGNVDQAKVKAVSDAAEALAKQIPLELGFGHDKPFVRGNVSIFVFSKRYDFGEYGRMVEKRDFPRSSKAQWRLTPEDATSAILLTRNQSPADIQVTLAQQLAALHVAGMARDVPRWFADGVSWSVTEQLLPKAAQIESLAGEAQAAMSEMTRLDDFVNNRIDADQAALVGYLFVKSMKKQSARAYKKLMHDLAQGESFNASFTKNFGMPADAMLKQISGSRNR
jgi:mono/diheme cytochrome c family protein